MRINSTSPETILIVDDEIDLLQGLSRSLSGRMPTINFLKAASGEEALDIIADTPPDLVLLDIRMGRLGGLEVMRRIHASDPDTTVIMMTAFASIELAVAAMHQGAWDFVAKPLDLDNLACLLNRGLERNRLKRENRNLLSRLKGSEDQPMFIGDSLPMKHLIRSIEIVAKTEYTVLVQGPSGTGKEIAARLLHRLSERRDKPFVMVNCPAIPEQLLESELFGHSRGAFTGAEKEYDGLFGQAETGTICLDEIGDIPISVQTKLLRVLQEKEVKKLGSGDVRSLDVRIIGSTNQDLQKKIRENSFREDLFYRLNVVTINTPSLQDITEDIPLIADHFLKRACLELHCEPKFFAAESLALLAGRQWPGNARQLQNTVRRAAMFCDEECIHPESLIPFCSDSEYSGPIASSEVKPYKQAKEELLQAFTERYVLDILESTAGNISRAARISGLTRAALQRILKRYEIEKPGSAP
ncbi:MAG: DNA-binding response regulator [Deltaproteobacteria bacterium]|nr:MAG: DNA-binding response regulator [Deltaproteobacteria bacterium]